MDLRDYSSLASTSKLQSHAARPSTSLQLHAEQGALSVGHIMMEQVTAAGLVKNGGIAGQAGAPGSGAQR